MDGIRKGAACWELVLLPRLDVGDVVVEFALRSEFFATLCFDAFSVLLVLLRGDLCILAEDLLTDRDFSDEHLVDVFRLEDRCVV